MTSHKTQNKNMYLPYPLSNHPKLQGACHLWEYHLREQRYTHHIYIIRSIYPTSYTHIKTNQLSFNNNQKEDYIKQVTKDLPQWLILKQQKEVEEMTNLKKSVEALHESRLAIKDEMTKHMQYMKGLNEKVTKYFLI